MVETSYSKKKMKKVIYTCLVGNYDDLLQPLVVDRSFDYICFTNDIKEKKIGIWIIRPIPYIDKDNTRLSRYVKILPQVVLCKYDYSLYMDANLQITGQMFYKIINEKIESGGLVFQVPHLYPPEDCIYDEIKYAFLCGKCGFISAFRQYRKLKKKLFPSHFGLCENNIILRKHNDEMVKKICEEWWMDYKNSSKRDQFNLMYIYWKNSFYPKMLFYDNQSSRNVDYLVCKNHNNGVVNISSSKSSSVKEWVKIKLSKLFVIFDIIYNCQDTNGKN